MLKNTPIAPNIQRTLHKKMAMLEAGSAKIIGINEETGKWSTDFSPYILPANKAVNYMYSRSPYIRVTSLTPVNENEPIILMGGELNSNNVMANSFTTAASAGNNQQKIGGEISDYDMVHDRGGSYNRMSSMPYRPMPGVK